MVKYSGIRLEFCHLRILFIVIQKWTQQILMWSVYENAKINFSLFFPSTKGSDVVQPEQEITVPLTVNHKTGEEDADKPGKGQENGGLYET